jgi:tetratricopeptide (TPR) repeat protein
MKPLRERKRTAAVLFALLLFALPAAAEDFPRLTPEEYIFPIRQNYRDFSPLELAEASFLLSGVSKEAAAPYLRETEQLIAAFTAFLRDNGDPESSYTRGELILDFLHETIFTAYDEFQTRTDIVLKRGTYNCVSSAVFYAVLAEAAGLPVQTVNTDDHVFCSVRTEKGDIDVETTSPYGFHPGVKREFTDSFGKTGFTYVPPGNYSKRDRGDVLALLSFILQNRIAELQKQKRYAESVGLAVDRYALVGDGTTFSLMITEFINYAAGLNSRGEYIKGIQFLRYARERYNTRDAFEDIYATLANNETIRLTDAGRYDASEALIDEWSGLGIISGGYARELMGLVYDRKAYTAVNSLPPREAEELLDKMFERDSLAPERYEEFLVFLYGKQAEEAGRRRDWLAAAEIMEEAIKKIGRHPQLVRALEGYRGNYAVSIHNVFADLYNSKQFEKALAVLEEGLAAVPDNRTLLQDLRVLREAMAASGK